MFRAASTCHPEVFTGTGAFVYYTYPNSRVVRSYRHVLARCRQTFNVISASKTPYQAARHPCHGPRTDPVYHPISDVKHKARLFQDTLAAPPCSWPHRTPDVNNLVQSAPSADRRRPIASRLNIRYACILLKSPKAAHRSSKLAGPLTSVSCMRPHHDLLRNVTVSYRTHRTIVQQFQLTAK